MPQPPFTVTPINEVTQEEMNRLVQQINRAFIDVYTKLTSVSGA